MADKPLILALANPEPEIRPEAAKAVRPDSIIATGRSDYPNQVNNVLCFPFIFRGALDVGATTINEEMKLAAVTAIAELAKEDVSDVVARLMAARHPLRRRVPDPEPFDPRLIAAIAPAVAEAAMDSGIATRPLDDLKSYRDRLQGFVYRSGTIMQPVFAAAAKARKRVAYAEGEDERVLRAVQVAVEEGLAEPLLIGRPEAILTKSGSYGLRLPGERDYRGGERHTMRRDLRHLASTIIDCRTPGPHPTRPRRHAPQPPLIGAMLLRHHETDGLLAARPAPTKPTCEHASRRRSGAKPARTLAANECGDAAQPHGVHHHTYINKNPTAEQLAEIALLAADEVQRFGVQPRVACFRIRASARRNALGAQDAGAPGLIQDRAPDLEVEGEMHGDAALNKAHSRPRVPRLRLQRGSQPAGDAEPRCSQHYLQRAQSRCGPGRHCRSDPARQRTPCTSLTPTSTVRRITNMTALTLGRGRHRQ